MAILGALSIARSGLIATGEALGVTSNNIANVNTIAFKGSRSEFADLFAGGVGGEVGLGTRLSGVSPSFTQGSIEATGRATDIAIEGNGFFVVRGLDGLFYTRQGNFSLSLDEVLQTQQGQQLQGFAVDAAGNAIGPLVDIDFGGAAGAPSPTTRIDFKNNLDAGSPLLGAFDGTDYESAYATSNVTTSVQVHDSLFEAHELTLFFTRTGPNAWSLAVGVDDGELGGTPGDLNIIGTQAITFNTDGSLSDPVPTDLAAVTFSGAAAQTIQLNFGTPNTTPTPGEGLDGLTQFGSASNVAGVSNGYGAGQLAGIELSDEGLLTAIFENGQSRALFRLALADFAAPEELSSLGSGLYRETSASGAAAISTAGTDGLGRIVGQAVERSNVDLAQEFVDLISLQRSFQANARVITTSDGLLNDLINIVR